MFILKFMFDLSIQLFTQALMLQIYTIYKILDLYIIWNKNK